MGYAVDSTAPEHSDSQIVEIENAVIERVARKLRLRPDNDRVINAVRAGGIFKSLVESIHNEPARQAELIDEHLLSLNSTCHDLGRSVVRMSAKLSLPPEELWLSCAIAMFARDQKRHQRDKKKLMDHAGGSTTHRRRSKPDPKLADARDDSCEALESLESQRRRPMLDIGLAERLNDPYQRPKTLQSVRLSQAKFFAWLVSQAKAGRVEYADRDNRYPFKIREFMETFSHSGLAQICLDILFTPLGEKLKLGHGLGKLLEQHNGPDKTPAIEALNSAFEFIEGGFTWREGEKSNDELPNPRAAAIGRAFHLGGIAEKDIPAYLNNPGTALTQVYQDLDRVSASFSHIDPLIAVLEHLASQDLDPDPIYRPDQDEYTVNPETPMAEVTSFLTPEQLHALGQMTSIRLGRTKINDIPVETIADWLDDFGVKTCWDIMTTCIPNTISRSPLTYKYIAGAASSEGTARVETTDAVTAVRVGTQTIWTEGQLRGTEALLDLGLSLRSDGSGWCLSVRIRGVDHPNVASAIVTFVSGEAVPNVPELEAFRDGFLHPTVLSGRSEDVRSVTEILAETWLAVFLICSKTNIQILDVPALFRLQAHDLNP